MRGNRYGLFTKYMQSSPAGLEDKLIVVAGWSADIDKIQTILRKQILHARVDPDFGKKLSSQGHSFGLSLHHRVYPEAVAFAPSAQVSVNGGVSEPDDGTTQD
jgi:hypothetical protein